MLEWFTSQAWIWLPLPGYVAGIVIASLGWRRSRKKGYPIIAAFFLIALILGWPRSYPVEADGGAYDFEGVGISVDAMEASFQTTYQESGIIDSGLTVAIYFLVVGLWLLVREESYREAEASNNGSPPLD